MKVALADVLWDAANVHLWDGREGKYFKQFYSCRAIEKAENDFHYRQSRLWYEHDFGVPCDYGDTLTGSFKENQAVRYMLLLIAMHVAEDEGVMIEVSR